MKTLTGLGVLVVAATVALMVPASVNAAEGDAVPTFTKDIAPIFQAKCEACHRPGSIAPMSLVTYQESRPWARSIRERVSTRQMPPWHIDPTVGITEFKNDRSLTDDQLDTIVRWVDGGAPRGNPEDMPPAVDWPDESKWNYAELYDGPPDLIIESTPYTVPAEAGNAWWKPRVPTGLTEERWARAIEIRPTTLLTTRSPDSFRTSPTHNSARPTKPTTQAESTGPRVQAPLWSGRLASRVRLCVRTVAS